MGIIDMRDYYRNKYRYVCEYCGNKLEFLDPFCEECGHLAPDKYVVHRNFKSLNLKKELYDRFMDLPEDKRNQLLPIIDKEKTQAKINDIAFKIANKYRLEPKMDSVNMAKEHREFYETLPSDLQKKVLWYLVQEPNFRKRYTLSCELIEKLKKQGVNGEK